MILAVIMPIRITLNCRKARSSSHVNNFYNCIVAIHMVLCLGWVTYALFELKNSDRSCWHPFTWQYLNYYLILVITLGPAVTLALAIVLVIVCMPCLIW